LGVNWEMTYEREEGEEQIDKLIHKLNVEQDFPPKGMIRSPHLLEM
jgi:hypothetical protein